MVRESRVPSSWELILGLESVAELAAVVVERALADEVAEPQRLQVRPRVWRMPLFRLVRFEDRAVHWPTREPERQQRA